MTTTPTVQYWNGSAWSDISTRVRSYSYTSGRRDEITSASAGMATFVLDNADSTIVGVGTNLLPKMTPIRVMVNGNTQVRWTGWVDGSPVTFADPEGTSSFVTTTAHDSLALMQRHICQTSLYEESLAQAAIAGTPSGSFAPAVCGYWPLSDPSGSTSAYEATGVGLWGALAAGSVKPTFGQTGVNSSQTTSLAGTGVVPYSPSLTATPTATGSISNGISFGFWFQSTNLVSSPSLSLGLSFGSSGGSASISVNPGSPGSVTMTAADGASHSSTASSTTLSATDGFWHSLVGTVDASGNTKVYLDGTLRASGSVVGWAPPSVAIGNVVLTVGNGTNVCHAWVGLGVNAGAAATLYAARNGLQGLTSDQMLGMLARWAVPLTPFGANAFDTQNNGTITPAITISGNDCLTLSQGAADTEDGPLFCTRSGAIANLTHNTLTDRAVAAPTAAFVNGDVEGDLTLARDAQYLVTSCQITALSGSGGVQSATKNLAKFGNYPLQKSLYVSDYQAIDYANWKTSLYGDIDYSRIGQFTVDLLCSVDIQAAALGIDIGSRVTFTGLPTQGGYTTADVIVQGFTENWTINGWSISFNTTPSSNYMSWVMEDATYGLLDSTTILGY